MNDLKDVLSTSLAPNVFRAPSSEAIKLLQQMCSQAAEMDELQNLRQNPVVKLFNSTRSLVLFKIDAGEALQQFI